MTWNRCFFLFHRPTYAVSPIVIADCSEILAVGILDISCRRCAPIVALQAVQRPLLKKSTFLMTDAKSRVDDNYPV